jgi:hypothetical protein
MINIFATIIILLSGEFQTELEDLHEQYSAKEGIYSAKLPIEPPEILNPLNRMKFPLVPPMPPINPPPITNVNPSIK